MPFEKEIAAAHETLAFFKGSPSWTPTLGVNVNACLLEHLLSLAAPAPACKTCKGAKIVNVRQVFDDGVRYSVPCPDCNPAGEGNRG